MYILNYKNEKWMNDLSVYARQFSKKLLPKQLLSLMEFIIEDEWI